MNDFLLHIYNYILEHLETDDPEYEENRTRASAQYGALMQALPPKQAVQLESYQYMSEIAGIWSRRPSFWPLSGPGSTWARRPSAHKAATPSAACSRMR